jgi:hypothetical protein
MTDGSKQEHECICFERNLLRLAEGDSAHSLVDKIDRRTLCVASAAWNDAWL